MPLLGHGEPNPEWLHLVAPACNPEIAAGDSAGEGAFAPFPTVRAREGELLPLHQLFSQLLL